MRNQRARFGGLIQALARGLHRSAHCLVKSKLPLLASRCDARTQLRSYWVSSERSGSRDQGSLPVELRCSLITSPPAPVAPRELVLAGIGLTDLSFWILPSSLFRFSISLRQTSRQMASYEALSKSSSWIANGLVFGVD